MDFRTAEATHFLQAVFQMASVLLLNAPLEQQLVGDAPQSGQVSEVGRGNLERGSGELARPVPVQRVEAVCRSEEEVPHALVRLAVQSDV